MWGSCNNSPDPYCQVSILPNTTAIKSEVRLGVTRKKNTNPIFQDVFSFAVGANLFHSILLDYIICIQFKDIKHLLDSIVRVSVWHDPLIGEKVFLGQVNIAIGNVTTPSWSHSGWYWLCPRPTSPVLAHRPDIGSLRVKVVYSQDVIYPLHVYDTLSLMLVESTALSVSVAVLI